MRCIGASTGNGGRRLPIPSSGPGSLNHGWRRSLTVVASLIAIVATACNGGDVPPETAPDTPIPATPTPEPTPSATATPSPTRVPRPTSTPVPPPPPMTVDGYLIETFSGIDTPGDMAFDGVNVWVAHVGDNSVSRLDDNGRIIATYPVGVSPRAITFDGEFIWVGNNADSSVTKLALDGEEIGTFPVGGGYTSPAAMITDGTNMWVVASWGNSLHKLAPDGEDLFSIAVPGNHPSPWAVTFDGESIWLASLNLHTIDKFSLDGELLGSFPVGKRNVDYDGIGTDTGGQGPTALAFDGEAVWVASNWLNLVIRLSTDGEILQEIEVGEWPSGLVFDGESVWVSNFVDNTVTRIALDGVEIITLPVGKGPNGMVVAGARPGHDAAIWVVNTSSRTLTKLTNEITRRIGATGSRCHSEPEARNPPRVAVASRARLGEKGRIRSADERGGVSKVATTLRV